MLEQNQDQAIYFKHHIGNRNPIQYENGPISGLRRIKCCAQERQYPAPGGNSRP